MQVTRQAAIALGLRMYTVCKQCPRCGTSRRYTTKSDCVACQKAKAAAKHAKTKNATPPWVDPFDLLAVYANCPLGEEVDHKVPLARGGYHAPVNLHYLPMRDNRSKSDEILPEHVPLAMLMEVRWTFEEGFDGYSEEGSTHPLTGMVEASALVQAHFLEAREEGSSAPGA